MRLFKMGVKRYKEATWTRENRKIELRMLSVLEKLEVGKNILWNIQELEKIEDGIKGYADTSEVKQRCQSNLEWWRELLYDYNEVCKDKYF
jgi:hypothetical protein